MRKKLWGIAILSFLVPALVWAVSEVVTRDTTQSPCPAIDDVNGECRNLRYNAATKGLDVNISGKGTYWQINSSPAAGSQATVTTPATSGVRHVGDCISYSLSALSAPVATKLNIVLRDGASGIGTVIWQKQVIATATVGNHVIESVCGLNLMGTTDTAMTLEFSSLLANEFQSVNLSGYNVQ